MSSALRPNHRSKRSMQSGSTGDRLKSGALVYRSCIREDFEQRTTWNQDLRDPRIQRHPRLASEVSSLPNLVRLTDPTGEFGVKLLQRGDTELVDEETFRVRRCGSDPRVILDPT